MAEPLEHSSSDSDSTAAQDFDTIQLVDEHQRFTTDLDTSLKNWDLLDAGIDYNVVAIFGSQSTGKSTLLNRLFGTAFPVMSETQRQQTTKGIWFSRAKDVPVMVMDVEGTDGRERGEDQDFERKSALFSIASSEVLIVNIWEHQIGLYRGANLALLRTVFEVNLALFGKRDTSSARTLLLFVIRDHIGFTPLSNLQATVLAGVTEIWNSLAKPEGLAHAKLTDYFDLEFVGLAHKLFQADQFEKDVAKLQTRFTDRTASDFVFKPAYHKRIPADGIPHYMESIWKQVQSNKDLDLPKHQILLAQYRCDKIASDTSNLFRVQAKAYHKIARKGQVVPALGVTMTSWKKTALERFDNAASLYHKGTYAEKRAVLAGQLNSALLPLFLEQLKNLHNDTLKTFEATLKRGKYAAVVEKARSDAETAFTSGAQECQCACLPPSNTKMQDGGEVEPIDTAWSYESQFDQLKLELDRVAEHCREEEARKANILKRLLVKIVWLFANRRQIISFVFAVRTLMATRALANNASARRISRDLTKDIHQEDLDRMRKRLSQHIAAQAALRQNASSSNGDTEAGGSSGSAEDIPLEHSSLRKPQADVD